MERKTRLGWDVPLPWDSRFWVNSEKQETKLSIELLLVNFQHEVSIRKSLSKQTTHGFLTWLLRSVSVREMVLEDITVMIITTIAFEGEYLFCEDCTTKSSITLSSLCLQNKQNWDSNKYSVPFSLRGWLSTPTASVTQKQGLWRCKPQSVTKHPSSVPCARWEDAGSLSVGWTMGLEGCPSCAWYGLKNTSLGTVWMFSLLH